MPVPLRVALISEHASPLARMGGADAGGQNVYVDQVARTLAARGHRVDVFTRRDDPALAPLVAVAPRLRVFHVDAGPPRFVAKESMLPFMPAFARGIEHAMAAHAALPDVVHANFFMSALAGLALRSRHGVPLVTTFHALGLVRRRHQGSADGFPAERTAIERRVVAASDRIVAECPQDRDDLIELYRAEPERIATVPCGVDTRAFVSMQRATARRALGLADDEFVILQLGRMVPRKGVDNVVRALARLGPGRRARLVVVGGGAPTGADGAEAAELDRLRGIAAACGVADCVVFAGHRQRDALPAYYAACDVFVTTPWYEPFGITPLEAMASARPVVGSAVGGIASTVVDGRTGFLVPPRDPDALADRLARLRDAPALGEAMGRAGRERVRTHYTWHHVAAGLRAVYRHAVDAARDTASRNDAAVAESQWPAAAVPGRPRSRAATERATLVVAA